METGTAEHYAEEEMGAIRQTLDDQPCVGLVDFAKVNAPKVWYAGDADTGGVANDWAAGKGVFVRIKNLETGADQRVYNMAGWITALGNCWFMHREEAPI